MSTRRTRCVGAGLALALVLGASPPAAWAQVDSSGPDGGDVLQTLGSTVMSSSAVFASMVFLSFGILGIEEQERIDGLHEETALYEKVALLEHHLDGHTHDVLDALAVCDLSALTEVAALAGLERDWEETTCAHVRSHRGALVTALERANPRERALALRAALEVLVDSRRVARRIR